MRCRRHRLQRSRRNRAAKKPSRPEISGLPRSRSAGVVRIVPFGVMNGSAPANLARPHRIEHDIGMLGEECGDQQLALDRIERAVGKDDAPAGLHHARRRSPAGAAAGRRAWRCLPAPSSRERRDGGAPCRSTSRARRAAPRRTASSGSYFSTSASTVVACSRSRCKVFAEALQPVLRRIERASPRRRPARAAPSCRRVPRKGRRRAGRRRRRAALPAGSRRHPGPTIRRRHSPAVRRPRPASRSTRTEPVGSTMPPNACGPALADRISR